MKKLNQSGFHLWAVALVIVIFGVLGYVGWKAVSSGQENFAQQNSGDCEDRAVSFTSPPLKMTDLGYIRPLGAMLDGHVTPTDHVYVAPLNAKAADNTYPVLMPADGTVTDISRMPDQYIGDRSGTQLAPEDHRIEVSFSCRYASIFIHIHKLAPALAAEVVGQKANESKKVSISLKAGDTFGYIGGDTFDWTPVDAKTTLKGYITPSLYSSEAWKIHTVSPFDLYTGTLKTQLEAKSLRTIAPVGGKIDYDQAGKLIGSWFRSGTGGYSGTTSKSGPPPERYWDGHLSVVPDYIDPSYTIVSIGNWQGKASQFLVKGSVNPATISHSSGLTKYELQPFSYEGGEGAGATASIPARGMHPVATGAIAGTIAFQVQSGEKLKVEKFVSKTAAQVTGFTSAAQTYER
ncbi:MAG: hypothetical protein JWN82_602 [Candidatus Saccharibacteria bacterium]|nr:hypothetical protein [Candidatus Saccharibacteria bacterium]